MHYDESSGTFREVIGSGGREPRDYTEDIQLISLGKLKKNCLLGMQKIGT